MKKILVLALLFSSTAYADWRIGTIINNSGDEVLIATRHIGGAPAHGLPTGRAYYFGTGQPKGRMRALNDLEQITVVTHSGRFNHRGRPGITYNVEISPDGLVFFVEMVETPRSRVARRIGGSQTASPTPQRTPPGTTWSSPDASGWEGSSTGKEVRTPGWSTTPESE